MPVTGGKRLHFVADLDNRPLARGAAQSKGIVAGMGRSFKQLAPFSSLTLGAAGVGVAATAMFAKVSKEAYQFSKDFETAILEVKTISKSVQEDFKGMSDQILNLSAVSPEGAIELTKGLYQIVSAGYDGAEAMDILATSSKLATAAVTTTYTAADTLTTIMNAYGDEAGTALEISDKLFEVVKNGKITMTELGLQIGNVTGLAAQAGLALDDLFAAYSTGTKTLKADIFTTGIKGLLTAIIQGPTEEALEVIERLGIEFDLTSLKTKGLVGFLQDLIEVTNGDVEVMSKLLPNVRGLTGLLSLATSEGAEFEKQLKNIQTATENTNTAYATMLESADNQWSIVHNKWKRELKELGDAITVGSLSIARVMNALLTTEADLNEPFPIIKGIADRIEGFRMLGDSRLVSYLKAAITPNRLVESQISEIITEANRGFTEKEGDLSRILGIEDAKTRGKELETLLETLRQEKLTDFQIFGEGDVQGETIARLRTQNWENLIVAIEEAIKKANEFDAGGGETKVVGKSVKDALDNIDKLQEKIDSASIEEKLNLYVEIANEQEFIADVNEKVREAIAEKVGINLKIEADIEKELEDLEAELQRLSDQADKGTQIEKDENLEKRLQVVKDISAKQRELEDTTKRIIPLEAKVSKEIEGQVKPMKTLTKEQQEQLNLTFKLIDAERTRQENLEELAETMGGISEVFGALGFTIGQLDEDMGRTFSNMADIVFNVSNLISNIGTNPFAVVSSGIGIIGNLFSLFRKDEDTAAESIDRMNESLERQADILSRMTTLDWLENIGSLTENISTNVDDLIGKLQRMKLGIPAGLVSMPVGQTTVSVPSFEKVNTADWDLDKWIEFYEQYVSGETDITPFLDRQEFDLLIGQLYELDQQLTEIERERQLRITGVDVSEVSESILQGIEEGLELGETRIQEIGTNILGDNEISIFDWVTDLEDFSESFGLLMEKSLRNHIKTALEDTVLVQFMENFTAAMQDGILTDAERTELQNDYAEGIKIAKEMWDAVMPAIEDLTSAETGVPGLTGAIRGITEETGGLIAGRLISMDEKLQGMVFGFAEQADFFDEFLDIQEEIRDNTDELSRLENIENTLVNMNAKIQSDL